MTCLDNPTVQNKLFWVLNDCNLINWCLVFIEGTSLFSIFFFLSVTLRWCCWQWAGKDDMVLTTVTLAIKGNGSFWQGHSDHCFPTKLSRVLSKLTASLSADVTSVCGLYVFILEIFNVYQRSRLINTYNDATFYSNVILKRNIEIWFKTGCFGA